MNLYKNVVVTALLFIVTVQVQAQTGVASYYGGSFHGKRTASGSIYNQWANTAAHRSLPFGSKVRVTNLKNKKSTVVTITDRGPYSGGRIIDLSKGVNNKLSCNLCKVSLKVLKRGDGKYRRR